MKNSMNFHRITSYNVCYTKLLRDSTVLDNYGGGKFDNLVPGLEYERIMSASGPFQGNLVRKSDQQRPKKVAWIQCVGSRGINRT